MTIELDGELLTAEYSGREQRECLRLGKVLPSDEAEKVLRLTHEIKSRFDAVLDSEEELYAPPPRRSSRPPRKRREIVP